MVRKPHGYAARCSLEVDLAALMLCDMENRGTNDISRELKFQPYDLLKAIGRSTGGRDHAQLRALTTTVLTTNIRVKSGQKTMMFSWSDQ